jgi:hypothetical protein
MSHGLIGAVGSLLFAILGPPAWAQSCDTSGILGYPPEPLGAKCVQATVTVPRSEYALAQKPPCADDPVALITRAIDQYASTQAQDAAASYTGPIAGVAAMLIGDRQAARLLGRLEVPSTTSRCSHLCVKLPANATYIEHRGMAGDNPEYGGRSGNGWKKTYCQPDQPPHSTGECALGSSDLDEATFENTRAGMIVCTTAYNWSSNLYRNFALYVYFR